MPRGSEPDGLFGRGIVKGVRESFRRHPQWEDVEIVTANPDGTFDTRVPGRTNVFPNVPQSGNEDLGETDTVRQVYQERSIHMPMILTRQRAPFGGVGALPSGPPPFLEYAGWPWPGRNDMLQWSQRENLTIPAGTMDSSFSCFPIQDDYHAKNPYVLVGEKVEGSGDLSLWTVGLSALGATSGSYRRATIVIREWDLNGGIQTSPILETTYADVRYYNPTNELRYDCRLDPTNGRMMITYDSFDDSKNKIALFLLDDLTLIVSGPGTASDFYGYTETWFGGLDRFGAKLWGAKRNRILPGGRHGNRALLTGLLDGTNDPEWRGRSWRYWADDLTLQGYDSLDYVDPSIYVYDPRTLAPFSDGFLAPGQSGFPNYRGLWGIEPTYENYDSINYTRTHAILKISPDSVDLPPAIEPPLYTTTPAEWIQRWGNPVWGWAMDDDGSTFGTYRDVGDTVLSIVCWEAGGGRRWKVPIPLSGSATQQMAYFPVSDQLAVTTYDLLHYRLSVLDASDGSLQWSSPYTDYASGGPSLMYGGGNWVWWLYRFYDLSDGSIVSTSSILNQRLGTVAVMGNNVLKANYYTRTLNRYT